MFWNEKANEIFYRYIIKSGIPKMDQFSTQSSPSSMNFSHYHINFLLHHNKNVFSYPFSQKCTALWPCHVSQMFILSIHSCHLKETFGCPKTWQSEKQGQRNRGDADITISKWCQELQQPYQVICYHDENKHLCIKVLCNGYTPQLVISENLCDKVCSDLLLTSSSLDKTLKKKNVCL